MDRFSSKVECRGEVVSDIHANHTDMTKFANPFDQGFEDIISYLTRTLNIIAEEKASKSKLRILS